jgi:hypothetical protein
VHLNEQHLHTPWQQKVFTKLLGLCYRVVYHRGVDNPAAGALSHRDHTLELAAMSSPVHNWMSDLQQWYSSDSKAQKLLQQLVLDPTACPPYKLQNGIITYKGRIWLGSNTEFQSRVLAALHDSPVGGHSGAPATLQKLCPLFFWVGMRASVLKYVQACRLCA